MNNTNRNKAMLHSVPAPAILCW